MGFIHEEHGRVAVETRGESLKLHFDYPNDADRGDTPAWYYQEGARHPEIEYRDILDVVEALMAPKVRQRWDNEEMRRQQGWRAPASVVARETAAGVVGRRLVTERGDSPDFLACMDDALHVAIESARRARRPLGFEGSRARALNQVIEVLMRARVDLISFQRNG